MNGNIYQIYQSYIDRFGFAEPAREAIPAGVSYVLVKSPNHKTKSRKLPRRYKSLAIARGRLYEALVASAKAGMRCPSNSELRRLSGLQREGEVTTALGVLRGKGLIEVQWTAPLNGARRILIPSLGILTDWSLHGPRAGGAIRWLPDDGTAAMGKALGPHRRFDDIAAAEARAIVRRSPADRKLPSPPRTVSPIGCPLADLPENPEFDRRWRA